MPIKMPGRRPQSEEDFVSGATATPATPVRAHLPWLDPKVRPDLRVQVNTKIPEPLALKYSFLAMRLGMRKQDAMEAALEAWATEKLRDLGLADNTD
ncbi:hypothetical protein ACFOD4_12905 [Pseudoroseomonas globiformis]|uniref:Chromosome partitioning protein ParB n=1 Tax=Teichococcus globiformis TaxID=2307229 RepID=A0ABV7G387_9PROT